MNSIGGCILEQVYCPPPKERHDSMDSNGAAAHRGFLQNLKESFYNISDAFSSSNRRSFSGTLPSEATQDPVLNHLATSGP